MEAYNNIAIVHCLILLHFVQCIFPRVVTSFKLSTVPGFLRAATEICSVVTTNLWETTGKPGNGKWELTQIAACCPGRNETIACKDLAHKDLQGWIRLHGDWYNSCKGCIIYSLLGCKISCSHNSGPEDIASFTKTNEQSLDDTHALWLCAQVSSWSLPAYHQDVLIFRPVHGRRIKLL